MSKQEIARWLISLANKVDKFPPNQYQSIDNITYFSKDYLESYDPNKPLKQIWDGWEGVTPENQQKIIDSLSKAVTLEQTRKEQEELNKL